MNTSLIDVLKLNSQGIISIIGAGGKTSLMFHLAKELAESGKRVLTTTTTKIFMPEVDQSPETIITDSIDELVEKSKSRLTRFKHFSAGSRQLFDLNKLKGFEPDFINKLWQADCFEWIIVEADGARQRPLKATDNHEPIVPGMTTHLIHVTGLDVVGKILDDYNVHRAKLYSTNTGLPLGEVIDEQSIAISAALETKKAGTSISASFLTIEFLNKADNQSKIKQGKKIAEFLKTRNIVDTVIIASLKSKKSIQYCIDI
jgi:probable selenium-dependent hydroxylase accessory protein YqeC